MFLELTSVDLVPLLWISNFTIACILFGLILVIQFVHYPSFHWIDKDKFVDFEKFHSRSISFIVLPLMVLELAIAISLLFTIIDFYILIFANLASIILIWLSTFLLSVPCHSTLISGKDDAVITKLIKTNWIRTILWGIRVVSLFYVLFMELD